MNSSLFRIVAQKFVYLSTQNAKDKLYSIYDFIYPENNEVQDLICIYSTLFRREFEIAIIFLNCNSNLEKLSPNRAVPFVLAVQLIN